jgi:pinin
MKQIGKVLIYGKNLLKINTTNFYLSRKRSSNHLDEDSDEEPRKRPSIQSSVVSSTMPIKTKEDLIKLQNKDSNSQLRNKRMLGFILGTLKEFRADDKQRSSTQQAQQRKELEEKIEIKKVEERQRMIDEKKRLEEEKYRETRNIEIVEKKIELTEQFEAWKKNQLSYKMFLRTKGKPHIYYLPKTLNEKTEKMLAESAAQIEKEIQSRLKYTEKEIQKLNEEIEELNKSNGLNKANENDEKDKNQVEERNLDDATLNQEQAEAESFESEFDEEKNNVRLGEIDEDENESNQPSENDKNQSSNSVRSNNLNESNLDENSKTNE